MEQQSPTRIPACSKEIETAEGCGCVPRIPQTTKPIDDDNPAGSEPSIAASDTPTQARPPLAPRRPLKIVLTLQPTADNDYHTVIAVGSPACDPLFRTVEVADLAAVLAAVPSFLEEAEARWSTSPRHPALSPPPRRKPTASSSPSTTSPDSSVDATPDSLDPEPATPKAPAKPSSLQLPLFG